MSHKNFLFPLILSAILIAGCGGTAPNSKTDQPDPGSNAASTATEGTVSK